MTPIKRVLLASCFPWLLSCSKDTFPKYIELKALRIIALTTTTPEISPGTVVTITPYVSDLGSTGPWTYSAEGCFDPGIAYGAEPTCAGSITRTVLANNVSVTAGLLSSTNIYTGNVDSISLSASLTTAILSGRSTVSSYNGVNYLVVYSISNAIGQTVKSFRRIVVSSSSKTSKNTNPTLSGVLANGVALGALSPASEVSLTASLSAGSAETYYYQTADGTLISTEESPLTTWFISDGEIKYFRTTSADVNVFKAPDSYPSTRKSFVLAVTHDGRGGVSLLKTEIH